MAMLGRNSSHHIRPANKEPEWSSICNNVLDQYLDDDDDDVFGLGTEQRGRSSSDDSVNLFDFSGSSERSSNPTSGTSPIPSWEPAQRTAPEAQQPKAKVPLEFWHRKLRALEQHAAASSEHDRSHKLRSTKSHPDFLSLGGYPSPPAVPVSPGDQSFTTRRQRSRVVAANGKPAANQRSVTSSRSVSRGRPTGVSKTPVAGTANPSSTSPSKMMTPSRYRAGFKNVWADRVELSPKKHELRLPPHLFPASPPPSAKSIHDSFAAFGSPIAYSAVPGCDAQVSPLARSFQQARIHTPITSPLLSPGSNVSPSYFEQPPTQNPYVTRTVPLNDTAPLYPERTDSLASANRIQTFDFAFSSSDDDPWTGTPFEEPSYGIEEDTLENHDPFGTLNQPAIPTSNPLDLGLGISCDPNHLVSNFQANQALPPTSSTYHSYSELPTPYYLPSLPNGLPNTSFRRNPSGSSSPPPPPPPQAESRSRRTSTSSRQPSRHRRTKSTNSTSRQQKQQQQQHQHQQPASADQGGFVNYTPQDHTKILSGVAPSGSSKTKARREKEALDKRRRLSQAAYAAVMAAGGSMEQLTKAGLVGDLAY